MGPLQPSTQSYQGFKAEDKTPSWNVATAECPLNGISPSTDNSSPVIDCSYLQTILVQDGSMNPQIMSNVLWGYNGALVIRPQNQIYRMIYLSMHNQI